MHPSLGAPNRNQVGVCLNNPDEPLIHPPPVFPQNMGYPSQPQVEIHPIVGCQMVLDHVGPKTILPTIPCNQSQVPL